MAMKNPPRRTTIRGQKHLLAYITPEEADVLKAMGGSGELHHGIPSYPDYGGASGFGDDSDDPGGDRSTGGRDDSGGGREESISDRFAREMAARGTPVDEVFSGPDTDTGGRDQMSAAQRAVQNTIARSKGKFAPTQDMFKELSRRAGRMNQIQGLLTMGPMGAIAKSLGYAPTGAYANLSTLMGMPGAYISPTTMLGPANALTAPTGGIGAFGRPAGLSQGYFGNIAYTGMPNDDYTGPFEDLVRGDDFREGGGDDVVPTQTNPVTGQEECPEGYVFDEDLQACRMGGDLPMDYTGRPGVGAATGDLYGRMGLLDIAPTGLGMFKERFGAGFGTPSEFDAANLAFRRSGGVTRPYEGYTLLS